MVSQHAYAEQQNSARSTQMTASKRDQHSDHDTTVSARKLDVLQPLDKAHAHTLRAKSQCMRR